MDYKLSQKTYNWPHLYHFWKNNTGIFDFKLHWAASTSPVVSFALILTDVLTRHRTSVFCTRALTNAFQNHNIFWFSCLWCIFYTVVRPFFFVLLLVLFGTQLLLHFFTCWSLTTINMSSLKNSEILSQYHYRRKKNKIIFSSGGP